MSSCRIVLEWLYLLATEIRVSASGGQPGSFRQSLPDQLLYRSYRSHMASLRIRKPIVSFMKRKYRAMSLGSYGSEVEVQYGNGWFAMR